MSGIVSTVIIAALIISYAGFVICRQIKKVKEGRCGGCTDCSAKIIECKKFTQG